MIGLHAENSPTIRLHTFPEHSAQSAPYLSFNPLFLSTNPVGLRKR